MFGIHAVCAAWANPRRRCHRLLATRRAGLVLASRLAAADRDRPQAEFVDKQVIERLVPPGAVHQGVALLVDPLPGTTPAEVGAGAAALDKAMVVVLDRAEDPRNVGAVLRSAEAFGALAVILPGSHAPEATGTLAKAASGALETVDLVYVPNLARALGHLKDRGFWCLGLDGGAETALAEVGVPPKVALVLGSEGGGLRRLTRKTCDLLARIPMAEGIDSLNLSAAAAIALYELANRGGSNTGKTISSF